MSLAPVLLLLGVGAILALVALVIVLVVVQHRRAKQRRADLATLAAARGWTYTARDDQWGARFAGALFGLGHNRAATNILVGQHEGRGFAAFDYVYYTTERSLDSDGSSRSREVAHPYNVVALSTGTVLPALSVAPEGFFGRLIGRLTDHDIELESEDFNRAFTVTCPSRRFASDVLHPRMMELLLSQPHFAFRFDGPSILAVRTGHAPLPEIDVRLALLDRIVDQVPEFVWRSVQGR